MAWTNRLKNLFRRDRLDSELAEEMASHIEEATEHGRSAADARKAFGNALQYRERSRDIKLLPWLDSLAADTVFGWRQLRKRPVVAAAAILSLALAIGSTTAAYRLVNAALLRRLPVADAERLFYFTTLSFDAEGHPVESDEFDYPTFRQYRQAVADRADLMVVGIAHQHDAVLGAGPDIEKIYLQYVSGNLFPVFGLQPALGRLLTPNDDVTPGAHPLAILSYDFWSRRFGRDPKVLGSTLRLGKDRYEVVGVAPKGFVGTEPGTITDIFVPAMMYAEAIESPGWEWFRIWVHPPIGFSSEQIRQPLEAVFTQQHLARVKDFHSDTPKAVVDAYLNEKLVFHPAGSGASDFQKEYRRPLVILIVLVILVLLVACINLGNLMTAQAAARERELALRVSIGAGHWRLIQLVLVESMLIAGIASVLGVLFATWSAPLVVAMLRVPEDPVTIVLSTGWVDLAFSIGLAFLVALLFGLAPALRASSIKPVSALKGGEDSKSRRRLMKVLLATQMAFCVLVQFVAGLFVSTFQRLSMRPLGFTPSHVLVMDASATQTEPLEVWQGVADRLRETPGVQSTALAGWPLLSRNRRTTSVRVAGYAVGARVAHVLDVSPGFFSTMGIGLINGREFRRGDRPPKLKEPAAVAIVNEAFARTYFDGQNPVGRSVEILNGKDSYLGVQIVGLVEDTVYYDVREPMRPAVFLPMAERQHTTFLVRTSGDPLQLAAVLRHFVPEVRRDIVVRTVQAQSAFVRWQMLRESLLASLSWFFAIVALMLAAVGLYGVVNYSVTGQQREIGIRMALGARPLQVVGLVTAGVLVVVVLGLAAGLAGGVACGNIVQSLLYEMKPTDTDRLAVPLLTLIGAAVVAVLPPALRAVKIDPARTLRSQ
ncbi:MAG TPA: ADOP family duplicated permease [Bryobacteraceae bacterium]|nr:ADOP family duplicated permease [Bryobacteraceae bacterium]